METQTQILNFREELTKGSVQEFLSEWELVKSERESVMIFFSDRVILEEISNTLGIQMGNSFFIGKGKGKKFFYQLIPAILEKINSYIKEEHSFQMCSILARNYLKGAQRHEISIPMGKYSVKLIGEPKIELQETQSRKMVSIRVKEAVEIVGTYIKDGVKTEGKIPDEFLEKGMTEFSIEIMLMTEPYRDWKEKK